MKNTDLKQIYDKAELNFHSGFEESIMIMSMLDSWQGLNVLEIGCGEGHLCSLLAYAGAEVHGIDYSGKQVEKANKLYPKLSIWQEEIRELSDHVGPYEIVVMQGVLEHLDNPWDDLTWIMDNLLTDAGQVVLSVPHWINPRGYIYHTLRILFDAKMTLTDLHFFLPQDFEDFCKGKYKLTFQTCDVSWGQGSEMIADFKERIPKALENNFETIKSQVNKIMPDYLNFLERMIKYTPAYDGANLGVKIEKT